MSERFTRRKMISQLAARAVEVVAENPQVAAPVIAGALLLSSSREARATILKDAAKAEPVGCAKFNEIETAHLNECVGPNKAGFYLTAELFENNNGKPGYQPKDGDKITRKFTEAEYLLTNTADRSQVVRARVNNFGELYQEKEGEDGKLHQVRIFIFSGEPNAIAENGMPALRIEVRNINAYDKTLKKVVELGDPQYKDSAIGCTPLPVYLWKDQSYLTPPEETVVAPPAPVTEVPAAPVQIPPAQVPFMPGTGGGSDNAPSTPIENLPNITPWPTSGGR